MKDLPGKFALQVKHEITTTLTKSTFKVTHCQINVYFVCRQHMASGSFADSAIHADLKSMLFGVDYEKSFLVAIVTYTFCPEHLFLFETHQYKDM